MRKFRGILAILLAFIIIYFLQINVFTWLNIRGIMPNLFVAFVLFIGLYAGKKLGIVFGILFGLILDLLVGKTIGYSSILLAIIGYIGEYVDRNFSKDNKLLLIILSVVGTSIYEIGMYAITTVKFQANAEIPIFISHLIVENIFNVLITIIIYPLIKKFGNYLENTFRQKTLQSKYFTFDK